MLRDVLIASVLICSACAMHLEYLRMDSDEDYLDDNLIESLNMDKTEKFSVRCWACTWVVEKVRKHLSTNAKAEDIKNKLHKVCDNIGIAKTQCKAMVSKYIDFLTEELSTNDDSRSICVKIDMCKPKSLLDIIQASARVPKAMTEYMI